MHCAEMPRLAKLSSDDDFRPGVSSSGQRLPPAGTETASLMPKVGFTRQSLNSQWAILKSGINEPDND
jgi:hypothetical protein